MVSTRSRPPKNGSRHTPQMLGSITQDSDWQGPTQHMQPLPVWGLWYETQAGSIQGDRERHVPLWKGFRNWSSMKEEAGVGAVGGSSGASPQAGPKGGAPPPRGCCPRLDAPERPREPSMDDKTHRMDAPLSRCGGGGAPSTSGPGRGGGSCAAPGHPS